MCIYIYIHIYVYINLHKNWENKNIKSVVKMQTCKKKPLCPVKCVTCNNMC